MQRVCLADSVVFCNEFHRAISLPWVDEWVKTGLWLLNWILKNATCDLDGRRDLDRGVIRSVLLVLIWYQ